MNPYKKQDLRKFIESIPQDVIDEKTRLQHEKNERVYNDFINKLKEGTCFLCNEKIEEFIESKPCFHWFTYPNGIKKKFFKKYLQNPIGFFNLDCYFRWLANSENPVVNVNDLKIETSKTSYLETTYKYRNIEWAFSIGHTDIEGHKSSNFGKLPHYHIQMKVDDRIFLKFSDYHIPFSDEDLFNIELLNQASDKVKIVPFKGQGMSVIEDEENLKLIDEGMEITDNFDNAPFERQTMILAPEGETISGELIQQAIEESKKTKKPIGKIMEKLLASSNAEITTIISPGKGVPEMTKRSGKK